MGFRYNAVYKGTSSISPESKDMIDRGRTYQLFVTLEKPEECILISCQRIDKDTINRTNLHPVFFNLDKILDLTHFGIRGTGRTYTSIGSNYNSSWTNNPDARICSSVSDPLLKITPGVYRLRFTTFTDDSYLYTVSVGSNNGKARITDRPPEDAR